MITEPVSISPADPGCINVIQITDMHVYSPAQDMAMGVDSVSRLAAVIEKINNNESPDLIIATGDLVHAVDDQVYDVLGDMLTGLNFPVYCLPGNHDHPDTLRAVLPGYGIGVPRLIDCGCWRFIMLDSVVPDSDGGRLDKNELQALTEGAATDQHVMVCLHHHPVSVGSPWMDAMIVSNGAALMRAVRQSPSVKGIAWGHIHQEFMHIDNERILLGCPSTCVQVKPNTLQMEMDDLPPAYRRLQLFPDGSLQTSIEWLN